MSDTPQDLINVIADKIDMISSYVKAQSYSQYDGNVSKFTGKNYNFVLDVCSSLLNALSSENISRQNSYSILEGLIYQVSERIDSIGVASIKNLDFKVDDTNTITYDGSTPITIDTIFNSISASVAGDALSSTSAQFALSSTSAQFALSSTSAQIALSSTSAQIASSALSSTSSNFAKYADAATQAASSEFAGYSTQASSSKIASIANQTSGYLYWIDGNGNIDFFNGSKISQISSLLFSVSSQFADQSLSALTAFYDNNGDELNTKVMYVQNAADEDFPILFANNGLLNSSSRGNAAFNSQFKINPKYGILKANYFFGEALCSIYSVADKDGFLNNTRVCQNRTSNSYYYPMALGFIDGNAVPEDGYSNQMMYASDIWINPASGIILTNGVKDGNETNIDWCIMEGKQYKNGTWASDDNTQKHNDPNSYVVNFVGLASRAICDISGNPVNQRVKIASSKKTDPKQYPIIFGQKEANFDNDYVGYLKYSNAVRVSPVGNLIVDNDLVISGGLTLCGDLQVISASMTYGKKDSTSDTDSTFQVYYPSVFGGPLSAIGNVTIGSQTGNTSLSTTINNLLYVKRKSMFQSDVEVATQVKSPFFIGIATSAQWADLAQNYQTDNQYEFGTLVQFGGQKQFTLATTQVNGVISENPAYLMNNSSGYNSSHQPIALVGRVKVRVVEPVQKFDYIALSYIPGVGISIGKVKSDRAIGRALQTNTSAQQKLVECSIILNL